MITFKQSGNFDNLEKFLKKPVDIMSILHQYGKEGVDALSAATPSDTGLTSQSWSYEIKNSRGKISLIWTNSNTVNGVPIVVFIQYGHATSNGGYVQGRDFINPVMQPIFDKIVDEIWKGVSK
jgi:hypothetical protein